MVNLGWARSYVITLSELFSVFKPFSLYKMAGELAFRGFLAATILFWCIQSGFSIKCWVCRSDTDPKCADPFDNSTVPITDCKQEPDLVHLPGVRPTMCRKIRQKVHGVWTYFRSCAYMGEPGIQGDERFCLMRTGTYNIFMEYCTCNSKDGCNAGFKTHGNMWLALLSTAVSLLCILFST